MTPSSFGGKEAAETLAMASDSSPTATSILAISAELSYVGIVLERKVEEALVVL